MIKFNITKAIGLIAFTVGVILFFKATNEKDLAIKCMLGVLGALNLIWGALALFNIKNN